jgi:hypothetical protein
MLDALPATPEACDPALGRFRVYRIEAGTDLLGDLLVDVTYGRIGSRGCIVRYVAADEAEARKIVRRCLQRRATAKRRIGVGYEIRQLKYPASWIATADGSPAA